MRMQGGGVDKTHERERIQVCESAHECEKEALRPCTSQSGWRMSNYLSMLDPKP